MAVRIRYPEHSMVQTPRTIVIVGAGFSGVAVAMQLLRHASIVPVHVTLIDRVGHGRGVAYATHDYPFLLNVPAGNMSAEPSEPHAFLNFLNVELPGATAEDFVPRSLYGDYLEQRLRQAESQAPAGSRLVRIVGSVTGIQRGSGSTGFRVEVAGGQELRADAVIIAHGNHAPAPLPGSEQLTTSSGYVADPWSEPVRLRDGETVLVVGTGLTMADVVIAGARDGPGVRMIALSRHGLLPLPQATFSHTQSAEAMNLRLLAQPGSVRGLLRAARELSQESEGRGADWREIIAQLRHLARGIWRDLPAPERARFLRHVRVYWDIHRHRLPQQTLAELQRLFATGQLSISAGRILKLQADGGAIQVLWRARGASQPSTLRVDRVINCTGPSFDPRRLHDALTQSLLANGLASADPVGLGLLTSPDGEMLDTRGLPVPGLYYIGPLLRADYWEMGAVPELREYARKLALRLVAPPRTSA
jgi:uncharacterized NAD(P)/FAD-binding protein YdhS